jgi:antitoxin YefM
MVLKLGMMEARKKLTQLPEELRRGVSKTVAVYRHGDPVLAIIPWDLYEGMIETLDIVGDPATMKALKRALGDVRKGRLSTTAPLRRSLHIA